MRLISQDGINGVFDFPYEKCIVYIYNDMKTIKIQPVGEENSQFMVARYSTETKALKVMEMLREEYLETVYDYRTKPKVFQFPKDEDVEV